MDEKIYLEPTMLTSRYDQDHICLIENLQKEFKQALLNYFNQLEATGIQLVDVYSLVLEQVERPLLEIVLNYAHNNQRQTVRYLGLSRSTVLKKLKYYNLT